MNLNTFFQLAVYICIVLLLFTLAVNFVNATGAFPITVDSGIETEGRDSPGLFENITGLAPGEIPGFPGGMDFIWAAMLSVTGIAAVAVAVLMHNTTPLGIWLFSSVFWVSYQGMYDVVNITGIFDTNPMASFFILGTVTIFFIWVAAIIGMFTGSG